MTILAIDTSGAAAGAALVNEYITIAESTINAQLPRNDTETGKIRRTHSEILLPMIDRLFTDTGMQLTDVDYVACTCGPGSFTGLRIGAATAKGLAFGAGKPMIPVPTLDALAYTVGYADAATAPANEAAPCWVVPMMDARRAQVYTAFYRMDSGLPVRMSAYMAEAVTDVLEKLCALRQTTASERIIFLGDGVLPNAETIMAAGLPYVFAPPDKNRQKPSAVGVCALQLAAAGHSVKESDFVLTYIRKPQAERERDERKTV